MFLYDGTNNNFYGRYSNIEMGGGGKGGLHVKFYKCLKNILLI